MKPLLQIRGIRKRYPGVVALDGVDVDVNAGEVHCLLGENGAGKSTLMKILSGAVSADEGEILVDGKTVQLRSPADSQALGIGIIHQEFKLVPELSVSENILLGNEPTRNKLPFIDVHALHSIARASLAQLGEEIDTGALVTTLPFAQRQLVEIAKALSKNVRILAMDEPSAALTANELRNLFAVIRRLRSEGVAIIYISHRLEEIFEIGDRVTILRDGKRVHTCPKHEIDRAGMIRFMVGRELEDTFPRSAVVPGKELLRVEHLNAGMLHDITFTLHQGEVLGIAGLVGAGRSELARVMFGADPKESGAILLEGMPVHPRSPREAIDLGIGLLTEDRNKYGLVMQMNIRENVTLSNLAKVVRGLFIGRSEEEEAVQQYSEYLRIKTPGLEQEVETLSGGNRQKVVLARWLFTHSKVLIFDEPTAGIDVGVKFEIYNLMNALVQDGIGVMVISSDLPELLAVSTRIAVMHEGRIAGILARSEATQEKIMSLATGGM